MSDNNPPPKKGGKDLAALRARSHSNSPVLPPAAAAPAAPAAPAPAPRRDKFAAKAARQQQQQQQQQEPAAIKSEGTSPHDTTNSDNPAPSPALVAAPAPRRDKFAAKAAAQSTAQNSGGPKRDKFASKAARMASAAGAGAGTTGGKGETVTTALLNKEAEDAKAHAAAAERKQRLLEKQQKVWDDLNKAEECIGQLLREVANHGLFDPDSLEESNTQQKLKKKAEKKKRRLEKQQRKQNKMETDEEEEEEEESEDSDSDDEDSESDSDATDLANNIKPQPHERYSKILQKLHSLCAPHAHWIKAYKPLAPSTTKQKQMSSSTTAVNSKPHISMYQARVEMRLAQEKRNICQEWLRLEREELAKLGEESQKKEAVDVNEVKGEEDDDKKRKREEVA